MPHAATACHNKVRGDRDKTRRSRATKAGKLSLVVVETALRNCSMP